MKRVGLSLMIAVLMTTAAAWAVVGQEGGIGSFDPFSIHVTHQEPVTVVATTTVDSGEVVTVTVPITVGVDLRVNVTGPGVVSVESAGDAESEVAVEPVSGDAPEDDSRNVMGGLAWSVSSALNAGDTYDEDDNFRAVESLGGDLLALSFLVENLTNEPIELSLGDLGDLRLEDLDGRQFGLVDGAYKSKCDYSKTAQPGIQSKCTQVFEVPDGNGEYVLVLFDTDEVEVGRVEVPVADDD